MTLVFLQILAILMASRLAGRLVSGLGQPRVIGEIIGGIMLGPSLLGWVAPDFFAALFPSIQTGAALRAQPAWAHDLHVPGRNRARRAALARAAWRRHRDERDQHRGAVHVGTLPRGGAAPTARTRGCVAARVRPVHRYRAQHHRVSCPRPNPEGPRLTGTKLGALAIACAAFDDVTGWLILAVVTAVVRSGDGGMILARTVVLLAVYALVMLYLVRPVLGRLLARDSATSGERVDDLAIVLALALTSALVTEYIGVHALFGAFIAGMVVPRESLVARSARERLEPLTATLLLPLFFAFTGLRTALPLLNEPSLWVDGAAILAVAVIGKAGASTVAARAAGLSWREAQALGILLNTRGLMELVVLNVGLELGILSPALFSLMVVMALVTTGATSPLLRLCRLDGDVGAGRSDGCHGKCEIRNSKLNFVFLLPHWFRPDDALVRGRDRRHAFVDKFLHALTFPGLRRVDVALRIDRDAVHAVELTGLASAVAEAGENLECVALQHVDAVVHAVGEIQIALRRVLRKGDVPHRSRGARVLRDEHLLHERAVRSKHLQPIVDTVAHVEESVV